MSWSVGFDTGWQRDIGYGVPAICDHPDCTKEIDRGLSYVCCDCGLYFCEEHHNYELGQCERCYSGQESFTPKPDVSEWTTHKETDPSWAEWRAARAAVQGERPSERT